MVCVSSLFQDWQQERIPLRYSSGSSLSSQCMYMDGIAHSTAEECSENKRQTLQWGKATDVPKPALPVLSSSLVFQSGRGRKKKKTINENGCVVKKNFLRVVFDQQTTGESTYYRQYLQTLYLSWTPAVAQQQRRVWQSIFYGNSGIQLLYRRANYMYMRCWRRGPWKKEKKKWEADKEIGL